jgi:hypothetical protein
MSIQSLNVRRKFSELKDIKEGSFYDFLVQLVKDPFDCGGRVTIWISDYTEHDAFHNFEYREATSAPSACGDEYGYTSKYSVKRPDSEWPGPYGKRSLQLTCYEPHASFLLNNTKIGSWIWLRNVQVKYGNNSKNLEGFLREDQRFGLGKINVDLVGNLKEDPENIDPRLKECLRRKRNYEKSKKQQLHQLEKAVIHRKRKAEDHDLSHKLAQAKKKNKNSRQRRKEHRAQLDANSTAREKQDMAYLNSQGETTQLI